MRRIVVVPVLVCAAIAIAGTGTASAHVPFCAESVNPHGQNTPPAGSTTLPGPNGGENEDGFYTFGPFASGSVIKYTQAPGAAPTSKTIGSPNGQAGAVIVHITGPDELVVVSIDGTRTTCFVPPPPK